MSIKTIPALSELRVEYLYKNRKEEKEYSDPKNYLAYAAKYVKFTYCIDNDTYINGMIRIFREEKELDIILGDNTNIYIPEDEDDHPDYFEMKSLRQKNSTWEFDPKTNHYLCSHKDNGFALDENNFRKLCEQLKKYFDKSSGAYKVVNLYYLRNSNEKDSFIRDEDITRIDLA